VRLVHQERHAENNYELTFPGASRKPGIQIRIHLSLRQKADPKQIAEITNMQNPTNAMHALNNKVTRRW
jgi:hypothetical protein